MLISNPMRFGTDIFGEQVTISGGGSSSGTAVVVTKSARLEAKQPLDCSNVSAVTGFIISGTEPINSIRRFMFKVDDHYYKFVNGSLYEQAKADIDHVLKWGNTAEQLTALTDIPELVGKQVYPIIALQAPIDSDFPTAKLQIKTTTGADVLSKFLFSASYNLVGDNVKIVDINAETLCTGQGSANVKCRLYYNSAWSSWLTLNEAANQPAEKIQFAFTLQVVNIGTDSVQVDSVTVRHTTGGGSINGDLTEIYTPHLDFEVPLSSAYLVIRHRRLIDSDIEASVAFLPTTTHKDRVNLGIATGSKQSYPLPDTQIDHASLQVFVGGELWNDFDFNLVVNEITLNAPKDSVVSASYNCNAGVEVWQPMTRTSPQQPYGDDTYASRFFYSGNIDNCSKAVMRIRLVRTTGQISYQFLSVATGYRQDFVLPHRMTNIVVSSPSEWSYDDDSQLLTVVAQSGKNIGYAGQWIGEQHAIYSFAAGFSL